MMEENLERVFARDPYDQMGGYVKRCRGLNVYCKLENDKGTRIQEIFAEGKPLVPGAEYQVAFVTEQGVPNRYGRQRTDLNIKATLALRNYIATNTPVTPDLRGSLVIV